MRPTYANPISKIKRYILALSLVCLVACNARENAALPDDKGTGSIVGVNYTGNGIQQFSIDGAWGGPVGSYRGGGGWVCCTVYPKKWTPDLKVTVKWERSDGREPDGKRLKLIWLEKTVPIHQFSEEGNVHVLFFPDDKVEVYISNDGVGSPDFPGKPGYPHDPNEPRNTKP
jgi:hypothetical protein